MTSFRTLILSAVAFLTVALSSLTAFAQLPVPKQMDLQTPFSPVAERIVNFQHSLMNWVIVPVTIFVFVLLVWVVVRFNAKANPVPSRTTHNVLLEVVWTLVPILILIGVSIPSMKLLYYADRTHEAEMTLKVTGYQWYWGYEYPDNGGINFSSYMLKENELKDGDVRLLSTDNKIILPVDTNIRILTTAADVIHSFAVPSLGFKLDAVPGRTNETWTRINKPGTYFGQCSELCGKDHSFMPIEIKAVSKEEFAQWVAQNGTAPAAAPAVEAPAVNP